MAFGRGLWVDPKDNVVTEKTLHQRTQAAGTKKKKKHLKKEPLSSKP